MERVLLAPAPVSLGLVSLQEVWAGILLLQMIGLMGGAMAASVRCQVPGTRSVEGHKERERRETSRLLTFCVDLLALFVLTVLECVW